MQDFTEDQRYPQKTFSAFGSTFVCRPAWRVSGFRLHARVPTEDAEALRDEVLRRLLELDSTDEG